MELESPLPLSDSGKGMEPRPGFDPGTCGLRGLTIGFSPSLAINIDYPSVKSRFLEYVKRYDSRTATCMVSYLHRYVKSLKSPMDIITLFNGLTIGQQHHLNRALRALFNFCEILGYDKAWLDGLRKAIPKDRIGIDLWIPEEDIISKNLRRLKSSKLTLKHQALWNLCLDSGIRLVEAISLINGFSDGKLQPINGFYRYEIGMFRENKMSYFAYFTDYTLDLIRKTKENGEQFNAGINFNVKRLLAPKYLRKFAFDKMIELEIPESIADFIEGRVPKKIGAKHYMALARQANKFYPKYGEYITRLRDKAASEVLAKTN